MRESARSAARDGSRRLAALRPRPVLPRAIYGARHQIPGLHRHEAFGRVIRVLRPRPLACLDELEAAPLGDLELTVALPERHQRSPTGVRFETERDLHRTVQPIR